MKNRDSIGLASGKQIYANCGIVGLDEGPDEHGEWCLSQGYDGGFPETTYSRYYDADDSYDCITKDEMLEVCDIMITRWLKFKQWVETQNEKTNPAPQ